MFLYAFPYIRFGCSQTPPRDEAVICDRLYFLCTWLTEGADEKCIPEELWNAKLNWLAEVTVMKSKIPLPPESCTQLCRPFPDAAIANVVAKELLVSRHERVIYVFIISSICVASSTPYTTTLWAVKHVRTIGINRKQDIPWTASGKVSTGRWKKDG